MENSLIMPQTLAVKPQDNKGIKWHKKLFNEFLSESGGSFINPDLLGFKKWLEGRELKPGTINSIMSTIKNKYKDFLMDRVTIWRYAEIQADAMSLEPTFLNLKALADELEKRLLNQISNPKLHAKEETIQDDSFIRLSVDEMQDYIDSFIQVKKKYKHTNRNYLIVCLMGLMGLRQGEITGLRVCDLRQFFEDEISLRVFMGKGSKTRLIPWGGNIELLHNLENYVDTLNKKNDDIIFTVTERQIQNIVKSKPAYHKGEEVTLQTHSLRRAYAKNCLLYSGMSLESIQLNMGHVDSRTTLKYCGSLNPEVRRVKKLYRISKI